MFVAKLMLSALVLAAVPAPEDATLLFVTTPGCAPCRQFAPLVREIAEMGYSVETIDAAQHPELVRDRLQVSRFPTFLMLSNDRIVDRVVPNAGPVNMKPRIMKMFEQRSREVPQDAPQAPVAQAVPPSPALLESAPAFSPAAAPVASQVTQVPPIVQAPAPVVAAEPAPPFQTDTPAPEAAACLASSVKLRVDAENTHSWGTGTIVDTRQGEALILTCGHIFRDSQGKGDVEVHLFGDNSSVRVFGRCLFYDLEIDLALVIVAPPCPVRAVPIAPQPYSVTAGRQVLSVGCDGGANPTLRTHRIMSIDRIGTPQNNAVPFHYIQVSGAPVSGRSGGGLFSEDGYLIGVCNTADPVENDGHFVPPHIIRHVLQKMNLAAVYESPSLIDASRGPQTEPAPAQNWIAAEAPMTPPMEPIAAAPPSSLKPLESRPATMEVSDRAVTTDEIQRATLEEINRRAQDGDEIVVFIKSRRNPEIPVDVIRLGKDPESYSRTVGPNDDSVIFSSRTESIGAQPSVAGPRTVSFPVAH